MSIKLKINIVLLTLMALSTGYFLHMIDEYEQVIALYQSQKYTPPSALKDRVDIDNLMGNPSTVTTDVTILKDPSYRIKYEEFLYAAQKIKSLYRYMFSTIIFLFVSLFVLSKALKKEAISK